MRNIIKIKDRLIGHGQFPLVIAEVGINHNGNIQKALKLVDDAFRAGCECVKFQSHIIEDEMIPNNVIPGNAKELAEKINYFLDNPAAAKDFGEHGRQRVLEKYDLKKVGEKLEEVLSK